MNVIIFKTNEYGQLTDEIENKGLLINVVVINNAACAVVALDTGNLTVAEARKVKVVYESGVTGLGSATGGDNHIGSDGRSSQVATKIKR